MLIGGDFNILRFSFEKIKREYFDYSSGIK
jgi:hypothetical protein